MPTVQDLRKKTSPEFLWWLAENLHAYKHSFHMAAYIRLRLYEIGDRAAYRLGS